MSLRRCPGYVFDIFRRAESYADRFTGAAGPLFVAIGAFLIVSCTFTFFEIIFPRAFLRGSLLDAIGGVVMCIYIVICFVFHYFMAICVAPGSPRDPIGAQPPLPTLRTAAVRLLRLRKPTPATRPAKTGPQSTADRQARRNGARERICKKCPHFKGRPPPKPERTHHCSVCGQCWLKFDHRINGCVGLHNERYFLLFMVYLSTGCLVVITTGWQSVYDMFGIYTWTYRSPRPMLLLTYLVVIFIGFSLFVMSVWQLWLIARGETSVESSDNDYFRKVAKLQGKHFVNPYDHGRLENLCEFFNVGKGRPYYTILLPLPYPPASDGWHWRHRPGAEDLDLDDLTSDEEVLERP